MASIVMWLMDIEEAKQLARVKCSCELEENFAIKTEWGYVFRSTNSKSKKTIEFPLIFIDIERDKVLQLHDGEVEQKIEIYSNEIRSIEQR